MVESTATIIEREGLFAQYRLIYKGPRGGEKVENISKKYSVQSMADGRRMIYYTAVGSGSVGITTRGVASMRSYSKKKSVIADRVFIAHEDKKGNVGRPVEYRRGDEG